MNRTVKLSSAEKRLLRQQLKKDQFNKSKEILIKTSLAPISQQVPTDKKPKTKKGNNPESIMQQSLVWNDTTKDIKGKWSWNIFRSQLEDDFHEIQAHLDMMSKNTWAEITSQTSNGHYTNHYQETYTIEEEAQKRLIEIEMEHIDTLFRFRLSGKKRLWGYVAKGVFYILWWDPVHKIYPVKKSHT